MSDQGWLSIDYKSYSPSQLVTLIKQLEGGQHDSLRLDVMRELIERLREKGLTDHRIIDELVRGVGAGRKRDRIATEWAPALGLNARDFKRLALGS